MSRDMIEARHAAARRDNTHPPGPAVTITNATPTYIEWGWRGCGHPHVTSRRYLTAVRAFATEYGRAQLEGHWLTTNQLNQLQEGSTSDPHA